MGSVERRLRQLESLHRAEAVAEVTRIFEGLTDREIALTITGMEARQDGREPTAEEVEAWQKGQESGVEEIIAGLIGLEGGMDEEEVSRRISALAKELEIWQGLEGEVSTGTLKLLEGRGMHLRRRLERLESLERGGETDGDREEHVRNEALRRVTTEDLETFVEYLRRAADKGGDPTPEEEAAILRYEELREKVRHELRASHH